MQIHHIFPFNFMVNDKAAFEYAHQSGLKPSDYRSEINDIANMTFLSKRTNIQIADLPPWQYLTLETSKEIRRALYSGGPTVVAPRAFRWLPPSEA